MKRAGSGFLSEGFGGERGRVELLGCRVGKGSEQMLPPVQRET